MNPDKTTIYRDIPRVDAQQLADLRGLTAADLYDALVCAGHASELLDQSLRPIVPGSRACGQAVTAFCEPGDSLMSHCALFLAHPGDVLVISNGGSPQGAIFGGNMAVDAQAAGLAGAIVDAAVRDITKVRELQFPLWAGSVSIAGAAKQGGGFVNMPVRCAGRTVHPGDIVIACDDGILIFSPRHIEEVVARVRGKGRKETALQERIRSDERLFETQHFGELLGARGIEIQDGHWDAGLVDG